MRVFVLAGLAGLLVALAPPAGASGGGTIRVASPVATAQVRRGRFRLSVRLNGGPVIVTEGGAGGPFWERADGRPHALGRVTDARTTDDGTVLTVDTDEQASAQVTLRWRTPRTLEVVVEPPAGAVLTGLGEKLRSPARELFYGLTERLRDSPPFSDGVLDVPMEDTKFPVDAQGNPIGTLARRGETVDMYVRPTFSLYAPFYHSSHGYGLAVGGTAAGQFDLAKTDPHVVGFRFQSGNLPEHQRLTFWIFAGPDYATILDEYTALTGRPLVPPEWFFGHWRWRDELTAGVTGTLDGVTVQGEVADDLQHYADLGLPAGVWNFDRPVLEGEFGFARFAWDATRLPNQDALLASLRSRGWRIVTWSSLWTCGAGPDDNGLAAQTLGYLVPGPVGTPHCADLGGISFILDPTNPAAFAWWQERVRAFVAQYALDGIKLDRGEEHIPSTATDVWADGGTGLEVRNAYPTLQAKLHHDALAAVHPDGDFALITRAGYTGTSHWANVWGGDIPGSESFGLGPGTDLGLRSAIISQQRAAFMGYPIWGSDTGGYYEFKDREVFARWLEFSCFSGLMEIGGKGNHAPWAMPTTPTDDAELTAIYARYVKLRATLHDYIVAAAQQAATGMPVVRPMPFYDRRDRKLADRWDEYLFGPDLLVAPVWHVGQRRRDVYLPRGRWTSYWDRSVVVKGPRTVSVDVPLDVIPVWVRGDAVVAGP